MITVNQLPIGQQYLCESSNSYAKTAKISFLLPIDKNKFHLWVGLVFLFWYRIRAEVRKNGLKGAIALLSLYPHQSVRAAYYPA